MNTTLTIVALLGLAGLAAAQQDAARALHDLFEREWEYQMQQNPTQASRLGDRRWNDRWGDLSLGAIEKNYQHDREILAELRKIERARLSSADQLNYDLFQKEYEYDIEQHPFRRRLLPLNQQGGIQTADELASSLPFENLKDYQDWTARLRGLPVYMDQTIALLREGLRARVLLPKIIMQRVPAQIDKQIVGNPEASPFYKPFQSFPASIAEADRARLRQQARQAIADGVVPAFRRLQEFYTGTYLPACFDEVEAWKLPQGETMYAFLTRRYTTTSLTPQQIHEMGLSEVLRIRAQMEAVLVQVGFRGALPEFFRFLRTDPRFYYKTPEDLLAAYRACAKRIDPNLVKVFRTLPRMPYGVEPIPAAVAPDTTTAYYRGPAADGSRAGTYFVNLYKPEVRPTYEMMALSLHESVPGHHLQIALAMEQGHLPRFRRHSRYTAFVEGWGLYAESLGEDMGLYDDPYSKFGQLTYEMWRAVRLVVDTGMHHFRWDRQKAIDYFMDNAAKTELDVVNEIDRYIATPGQALAYKIGELKIKQLRARAASALGERLDLREFHEVVLRDGALPLDILERNVDQWLAGKKALQ